MQTPRFCGHCSKCWDLDILRFGWRGLRISCWIVGIKDFPLFASSFGTEVPLLLFCECAFANTKTRSGLPYLGSARWNYRGSKLKALGSCPLNFECRTGVPRPKCARFRRSRRACQHRVRKGQATFAADWPQYPANMSLRFRQNPAT